MLEINIFFLYFENLTEKTKELKDEYFGNV